MKNSTKLKKQNTRRYSWNASQPRTKALKKNGCTDLNTLRKIWLEQQMKVMNVRIPQEGCNTTDWLKEIAHSIRGRAGKIANHLIKRDIEAELNRRNKEIQERAHRHVKRNAELGMYDLFPHCERSA